NDYEPSFSPVINIVTLPRITLKSTSKITSPDYPHDFSDVDDEVDGDVGVGRVNRVTEVGSEIDDESVRQLP
ncbi:hypothetical protein AB4518_13790, partial [Vibrio sp. 10N.222.54.E8]|uniref:hypothetical protein n=1 Tax=Vibrio sp. 10N.222.54.E8 TaxID=3229643 RepID=UPI00354B3938